MFEILSFLVLLGLGYAVGGSRNRRHLQHLDAEEKKLQNLSTTTGILIPGSSALHQPRLVCGGTVISVDYFKRAFAILRTITGGRVKSYESLLERGRREAVLRMKQDAQRQGADAIINVRIETTRIANGRSNQQIAGLEILAYGTAVQRG